MARFYGSIHGSRGKVSRLGDVDSGMNVICAGWHGGVSVRIYNHNGEDYCCVRLIPWHDKGQEHTLYTGPVNPVTIGHLIGDITTLVGMASAKLQEKEDDTK